MGQQLGACLSAVDCALVQGAGDCISQQGDKAGGSGRSISTLPRTAHLLTQSPSARTACLPLPAVLKQLESAGRIMLDGDEFYLSY